MAYFHSPRISTDGLVLYLDAGNRKSYGGSGIVWKDLSGNDNNGTLTNGPTFDSGNGGTITIDTIDDSVIIAPPNPTNNITDELTAEIFFQPTNLTNTFNAFIYTTDTSTFRFYRNAPGTSEGTLTWLVYYYDTSNTLRFFTNYISYNLNEWACTSISVFNNGVVHFFKNGQFIAEKIANNFSYWDIVPRVSIPTITLRYINISSVKIYNRALTSAEILQNYNATKNRFGL
jgi:hypothetical protein